MSLLDCQRKIDISLMSENQFGSLKDNGNPNKFKTWGTVMVLNTLNQETFSPFTSEEKTIVS